MQTSITLFSLFWIKQLLLIICNISSICVSCFFFFFSIIEYNTKTLFSSFEWRTLEAFKTVAFITTTVVGYEYFNKVWKQPSRNTLLKGARALKKCFKFLTFSRNWTALGECFQQLDFQVLFNKLFYVPF